MSFICIKSLQNFQAYPKCHVPANKVNKYTITYLFDKYLFITFYMAGPTWGAQHSENSSWRNIRSWHQNPSLHGKRMGKDWQTFFGGGPPKSLQMVTAAMKLKMLDPWKKVMTNLDYIWKCRDITFPTKFHLVKAMVFPVVVYGCESWTVKKTEPQRIDTFEL